MAIRARLTTAEELASRQQAAQTEPDAAPASRRPGAPTEEEKAARKARVASAKDALKRSATLRGDHVGPARAALKSYLQHLNDPDQPSDAVFEAMLEAPFRAPDKGGRGRRGRDGGRDGGRGGGRDAGGRGPAPRTGGGPDRP